MGSKGWVKLYREQFSHWVSKIPFCDGYAWTYLYSQANHKRGLVNLRNEYIEINRGEFLTSKLKLQKIFGWTRRHLENFLNTLKKDQNITYRVTNRYIVITIINYDIYQGYDENNDIQNDQQMTNRKQTDDQQKANRKQTDDQQMTTNKNEKNVKNEKNDKNDKKNRYIVDSTTIEQIIFYLNTEAKKNYKVNTPLTRRLINARLKEGYSLEDFKKVIDIKVREWLGKFTKDGKDMGDWLRPQTLFGTKFESYLNQSDFDDNERFKFLDKEV